MSKQKNISMSATTAPMVPSTDLPMNTEKITKKTAKKATTSKRVTAKKPRKKPTNKTTKKSTATSKKSTNKIKKLPARKSILKHSSSAWILFSREHRPDIRKQIKLTNPDIPEDEVFGKTCKELAVKWKSLSDSDKKPYNDGYEKDRQRYEKDKAKLTPEQHKMLRMLKRERRKRRREGPSPALSAFMLFVQANRKQIVEEFDNKLSFADVGRTLGKRWNEMIDEKKVPFRERATIDRRRYDEEFSAYKVQKTKEKEDAKLEKQKKKLDAATTAANAKALLEETSAKQPAKKRRKC